MSIHLAMRPVRRMVQCEGIVSLAMPCSVIISGQWDGDNESLFAVEPHLQFKTFLPPVGIRPGAAKTACQCLTH